MVSRCAAICARRISASAAGAILYYLRDTQKSALEHLDPPAFYDRGDAMILDAVTVRNLELLEPLFAGEKGETTLIHVLDRTATGMGGRLIRQRLLRPSLSLPEIEARLSAVEELYRGTIARAEIVRNLERILDVERLIARLALGTAGARELLALGRSLAVLPALKKETEKLQSERLRQVHGGLDEIGELRDAILTAIAEEPPVNLVDGGTIRDGYHAGLDELRDISRNSKQYIAQIEQRERARTGIQSLKVRFNNVFGYYIEISKANLHLAPADYERKQTLVNAERFTTPELKDLESKILDAEEKILTLEREIFQQLRVFAASHAARLRATAAAVAELDVTCALAQTAAQDRYVRPVFSESGEMRVVAGRHPVIEKLSEREGARFIPNDLYFAPQDAPAALESGFIAVITGPNMGGKSTYLRQAALMAILAQAGSFVPADSAVLPVIDRVFTRIGASDDLAGGRSTFMVEMTESAAILHTATEHSLVLMDEIGRGTSTFDGLALAWAIARHLLGHNRCYTLFATHYFELTQLPDEFPQCANVHLSAVEHGEGIVFLHAVQDGPASQSYGLQVAQLAGVPMPVIRAARKHLALLEQQALDPAAPQLDLFAPRATLDDDRFTDDAVRSQDGAVAHGTDHATLAPAAEATLARLAQIDPDDLRPREALDLLYELRGLMDGRANG